MDEIGKRQYSFHLGCSFSLWQRKLHREGTNWDGLTIKIRPTHSSVQCY